MLRLQFRICTAGWLILFLAYANNVWGSVFLTAPSMPVGVDPIAIVAGDFNNDGQADFVTANFIGQDLSIVLSVGGGKYATARELAVNASSLVTGDFNRDGNLDLAATGLANGATGVVVMLGNGDGTFQNPVVYSALDNVASSMITADFNGDGHPDLAVIGYGVIGVYLGNPDGTFGREQLTSGSASGIVAGDFNGDGITDLAAHVYNFTSNSIAIYLGNNHGTFQPGASYTFSTLGVTSMAVGDLNRDGILDIVVAGSDSNYVGETDEMLGNGDGTFQPAVQIASLQTVFVVADFNNDGRVDLAGKITSYDAVSVTVLIARANGGFAPETVLGDSTPAALITGDFNGDGKIDLATANAGSDDITLLMGNGHGTFKGANVYFAGTASTPFVVGDLNGDRLSDIVFGDSIGVHVLLASGHGQYSGLINVTRTTTGALVLGDFNGDGKLDLISESGTPPDLHTFIGNGDGTFQTGPDSSIGQAANFLASGDFNGDGKLDVAAVDGYGEMLSIGLATGGGAFQPASSYALDFGAAGVVVGDFNHDGNLDIAVLCSEFSYSSDSLVELFAGNGDGTFQSPLKIDTGAYQATGIALADFNRDGNLDLAVSFDWNPSATVILGNGDGSFQAPSVIEADHDVYHIVAGDFDGDGISDIITDGSLGPGLSFIKGRGNGRFAAAARLYVPGSQMAVAFANEDLLPDLIVSYYTAEPPVGVFGVLLNTSK